MLIFRRILFILLTFFLLFSTIAKADTDGNQSQVILTLNADKWLTSQTANVQVAVYALLTEAQLSSAQENILAALQGFSPKAEWHIVQMQRSKNQANLEQLEVIAEARLPNQEINNLRQKAQAVSKQGETYEIKNIDYSPSDAEIASAQFELRQKIYQLAKAELNSINQVFPNQPFYLLSVNFNSSSVMQPRAFLEKSSTFVEASVSGSGASAPSTNANIDVSQHLSLAAEVILTSHVAAKPKSLAASSLK